MRKMRNLFRTQLQSFLQVSDEDLDSLPPFLPSFLFLIVASWVAYVYGQWGQMGGVCGWGSVDLSAFFPSPDLHRWTMEWFSPENASLTCTV